MEKKSIKRDSLKHNFLKSIIIRLDFQGVLASELEEVLEDVKKWAKIKGFNRYEERIRNVVQYGTVNEQVRMQNVPYEVIQKKVYYFINDDLGYDLELSDVFALIKIDTIKYRNFDEYSNLFFEVCSIYRNKIDFFTSTRLGLRKTNICFANRLIDINKYFEDNYYQLSVPVEEGKLENSYRRIQLNKDIYDINISSGIENGELGSKPVYKIVLDSDIYIDDKNAVDKYLFENKCLNEMNMYLFNIYLDSLTDNMVRMLMSDSFGSDEIIGVAENG